MAVETVYAYKNCREEGKMPDDKCHHDGEGDETDGEKGDDDE